MVEDHLKGKDRICLFSPSKWLTGLLMAEDNHLTHTAAALLSDKVAIPLPFLRKLLPSGYKAECILAEGQQIPYLPHWRKKALRGWLLVSGIGWIG